MLDRTDADDKEVKDFFKPEFRNRLDAIVKFKSLDTLSIKKVVNKFMQELNELLSSKQLKVRCSESCIDALITKGYDKKMGARPLGRKIDELIRIPLSKRILFEGLENCALYATVKDDCIEFTVQDTTTHATVDQDGYIRIT